MQNDAQSKFIKIILHFKLITAYNFLLI